MVFSCMVRNSVSASLAFTKFSFRAVSVFAAPVTRQDQGRRGSPSPLDRTRVAGLKVLASAKLINLDPIGPFPFSADQKIFWSCRAQRIRKSRGYSKSGPGSFKPFENKDFMPRRIGDRKETGNTFGIGGYSTVSSAAQRVKVGMERDERFQKGVHNLISIVSKSQEQTCPLAYFNYPISVVL